MTDYGSDTDEQPADTIQIREPKTGRFVAGAPSGNPHGRPRKGQTIAERVAKADAKIARDAIKARDKRLKLTNAVGERAWSTYLAYNLGLPKQEYVISRGDDPLTELMQELAARRAPLGAPIYIEGESRTLDGRESGDET